MAQANPVRLALTSALKGSNTLTALLGTPGGVYHRKAPQPAKPPVVVFDNRSSLPTWAFGGEAFTTETWAVRGIAFGRTAERAEEIAYEIERALTDAPLVISGRRLMYIRQDSGIDFPEQVGKEIFQHTGAVYRIIHEPIPATVPAPAAPTGVQVLQDNTLLTDNLLLLP